MGLEKLGIFVKTVTEAAQPIGTAGTAPPFLYQYTVRGAGHWAGHGQCLCGACDVCGDHCACCWPTPQGAVRAAQTGPWAPWHSHAV